MQAVKLGIVLVVGKLAFLGAMVFAQEGFQSQTLDANVAIGYGVAIGDVDGDGKPDILLADQKQFVWYHNPDWKRHVMVENLTEQDNVCIAARDIDGDGKVEVAVGAQWNPGDTVNSGSVHYLIPQSDRTLPWKAIELIHEPVVHRMRWVDVGAGKFVLAVAPLHGRGNINGDGQGVRLLAYEVPANPETDPWTTVVLDDQMHVTHNMDVGRWDIPGTENSGEKIAWLGKEGAMLIWHAGEGWRKQMLPGIDGGSEIRMGWSSGQGRWLATVEPFHGDKMVVYQYESAGGEAPERTVLNPNLAQGHALASADFLKRGSDQLVVGWRNPNSDNKVGIMMHWRADDKDVSSNPSLTLGEWTGRWIDENGMACEDLQVADLDADGDLDIVASGRSTHNLKIYWNQIKQPGK